MSKYKLKYRCTENQKNKISAGNGTQVFGIPCRVQYRYTTAGQRSARIATTILLANPAVKQQCCALLCFGVENDGGRCLPAFAGRKLGEICNRENQCEAGLVCEEVVPGEMHVCRPPTAGRKQYNEDCSASSECDITRGLCCVMQRRHRQKARKSCGYFKEPLVCIGPVATDQIREFVQHTAGEKRIGVYRLH
ncbi:hypothetical protein MSG28_005484 [Choristoneura fumiferana]|uniref:Uncharacterized protein n=1 Tax=Choristoneura fumiferana TaxID=7141 RepID=A0ACC0KZ52_CHOFU|nr:hypothetical protein MSG28_005484 [Choristoneura fumiferana]